MNLDDIVESCEETGKSIQHYVSMGVSRDISSYDNGYFCTETLSRGTIVAHQPRCNTVGKPYGNKTDIVGILLSDVVNIDMTRNHINWNKDEVQMGGKVSIATNGKFTLTSPDKFDVGDYVGYDNNGSIRNAKKSHTSIIGTALSSSDIDNFVKVHIHV